MTEYFNDIIEQQTIPEPEPIEPHDLTCDTAHIVQRHGKWFVDGYRDGQLIVSMGGWDEMEAHVNAVLYDSEGNEVEHVLAEPRLSDIDVIMIAIAAIANETGVNLDAMPELVRDRLETKLEEARVLESAISEGNPIRLP